MMRGRSYSRIRGRLPALVLVLLSLSGCAGQGRRIVRPEGGEGLLPALGYAIQVGAFARVNNAARLTGRLAGQGLQPYYFRDSAGLYKVRFGDFPTREVASRRARKLKENGVFDDYFIVGPGRYQPGRLGAGGIALLRNRIVDTAVSFLGIPYRWGGSSPEDGFDCSGLAMAVYRLNGLRLPRNSRDQFRAGRPVHGTELHRGDLVFFATSGGRRVSHVGIYTGRGRFIHAPGTGARIQTASLESPYFRVRYVGARSYLRPGP